ncbi:MAG: hypothetical protein RIS92_546 [Verrucomicrobiota bacterium]
MDPFARKVRRVTAVEGMFIGSRGVRVEGRVRGYFFLSASLASRSALALAAACSSWAFFRAAAAAAASSSSGFQAASAFFSSASLSPSALRTPMAISLLPSVFI